MKGKEITMEELKKIFSDVTGIEINEIRGDISRDNNDLWDSFNHLMIISEIESKLNIKFTMEEVENIRTFSELDNLVQKKFG